MIERNGRYAVRTIAVMNDQRYEIIEQEPLYAGSQGRRLVVVDRGTGVQLRTFRDRSQAESFLARLQEDGLAGWQEEMLQRVRDDDGAVSTETFSGAGGVA